MICSGIFYDFGLVGLLSHFVVEEINVHYNVGGLYGHSTGVRFSFI